MSEMGRKQDDRAGQVYSKHSLLIAVGQHTTRSGMTCWSGVRRGVFT